MSSVSTSGGGVARLAATANDRLKQSWGRWVWGSISMGVVLHATVFLLAPRVEISVLAMQAMPAPQLLRISAIAGSSLSQSSSDVAIPIPALPTTVDLSLDFTIEPTIRMPDFRDLSALSEVVVPVIETERNEWLDYQSFAPYVVRPQIRNRTELKKFLERHYQPILEFSGATGVVQISFWIDEAGLVEKAEIAKSSGSRSLDRLAMRLSRVLRFRPAMLAGRPVRMQVRLPITFRAA